MRSARKSLRSTNLKDQLPAEVKQDEDDFTTIRSYKKIIAKKCVCPFKCCTCDVVGNGLIKLQFANSNNVLIEDDSKLIYSFFGREVVK